MEANVWPWGVGLGLLSKVLVLTEDGSSLGAGGSAVSRGWCLCCPGFPMGVGNRAGTLGFIAGGIGCRGPSAQADRRHPAGTSKNRGTSLCTPVGDAGSLLVLLSLEVQEPSCATGLRVCCCEQGLAGPWLSAQGSPHLWEGHILLPYLCES